MKKLIITALALILALTFNTMVFAADIITTEMAAEPAKPSAKAKLIDINAATEEQLKATLGVGDEDAKKIIANRPYTKKDQLKTNHIIHVDVYEKIKKLIDAVC